MSKKKTLVSNQLHEMPATEINQAAIEMLDRLLEVGTLNLISDLTRITRPTLYRWLDADVELERMSHHVAGWFLVICETSPKVQALLKRGALSHPRLAKRVTDGVQ